MSPDHRPARLAMVGTDLDLNQSRNGFYMAKQANQKKPAGPGCPDAATSAHSLSSWSEPGRRSLSSNRPRSDCTRVLKYRRLRPRKSAGPDFRNRENIMQYRVPPGPL